MFGPVTRSARRSVHLANPDGHSLDVVKAMAHRMNRRAIRQNLAQLTGPVTHITEQVIQGVSFGWGRRETSIDDRDVVDFLEFLDFAEPFRRPAITEASTSCPFK